MKYEITIVAERPFGKFSEADLTLAERMSLFSAGHDFTLTAEAQSWLRGYNLQQEFRTVTPPGSVPTSTPFTFTQDQLDDWFGPPRVLGIFEAPDRQAAIMAFDKNIRDRISQVRELPS